MRHPGTASRFWGLRPDLVVVVGLLAGGCDDVHRFENEGRICVGPAPALAGSQVPGSQRFEENQPLFVLVMMPECLNSCSRDREAACEAKIDGTAIVVTSHGSFRQHGSTCTKDCRGLAADCSTGPLAAGTYEIRHGEERISLTIPSTVPAPCAGHGPGGFQ
jgi:hypothetical protein